MILLWRRFRNEGDQPMRSRAHPLFLRANQAEIEIRISNLSRCTCNENRLHR